MEISLVLIFLVCAAVVFVLLIVLIAWYYNRFVALKNILKESWSGIDIQLKRRYDLIPNLVGAVKGYANFEQDTLTAVIEARSTAMSKKGPEEKADAENEVSGALGRLLAIVENYPELKANEGFLKLQQSLIAIEDEIQLARRYYNAVVRDYNTLCCSFPSVIFAKIFHFEERSYFEVESAARDAVEVNFDRDLQDKEQ